MNEGPSVASKTGSQISNTYSTCRVVEAMADGCFAVTSQLVISVRRSRDGPPMTSLPRPITEDVEQ